MFVYEQISKKLKFLQLNIKIQNFHTNFNVSFALTSIFFCDNRKAIWFATNSEG